MATLTRIAIIGSAGRKKDASKMSLAVFKAMICSTKQLLQSWNIDITNIVLVSGGSAWSDHVAVKLYLEELLSTDKGFAGLELHLPCQLLVDDTFPKFDSSQCGQTLNGLQHQFSNICKFSSVQDLRCAVHLGASIRVHKKGFLERNLFVGNVDRLIAFTWNNGVKPKEGGTLHTWNHSSASMKVHVSLGSLLDTTNTATTAISLSTPKRRLEKMAESDDQPNSKKQSGHACD